MLSDKSPQIGLHEFIEQIKRELLLKKETDPLFAIAEVNLEINITVERTMNGGVDLKVIQSGVEKTITDVHTVSVKLEPIVTPDEQRARLSAEQKESASERLTRSDKPKSTRGGNN